MPSPDCINEKVSNLDKKTAVIEFVLDDTKDKMDELHELVKELAGDVKSILKLKTQVLAVVSVMAFIGTSFFVIKKQEIDVPAIITNSRADIGAADKYKDKDKKQ